MYQLGIIMMVFFIFSCKGYQDQEGKINEPASKNEKKIISAIDLEPRLAQLDSLQVLFFDDPYGDSIRYTRFFSLVNSNEPHILEETKKHFHQPYFVKTGVDTCRSEGKIYLLANGEPVKTLYFSFRCPTCCYSYFIKDGSFYYFEMNDSFREVISSLKKISKSI